ncbi:MAG TPA: hydantoinase/carbamoylase family amidase [Burkholderiales bacterium]|nr:hydantoinase/carbamoylase family amidase [Burkholderiales bacterium]
MSAAPALALERLSGHAERLFEEVRAATFDGVGITRASYGEGEERAMAIIERYAREVGLVAERDAGQNLTLRLPTEAGSKPILIGSHLDSVPQGGNFDGLAGVIAGLLVLQHYRETGIVPSQPVRVLALRGEESAWFGKAYMGSLGLVGKLTNEDLDLRHRETGTTLRSAFTALGMPVDRIERGEPLLDLSKVAAYIELHIEQGPAMVARKWPVAIVTGIRGNLRHARVLAKGEAGHSGAVPRWLRKDPVLAVAELLSRLDEHWRVLQQMGMDLVMTCGILSTNPASHAISVIPGEVSFSFEVRSQSRETLEQFYKLMRNECEDIAAERGVQFQFDRRLYAEPATMDPVWMERLLAAGRHAGLEIETIASGAGHDAAVFANAGVPSGMVFIRNRHGSHNPHEAMEISDFMIGVDVLNRAIHSG